MSNKILCPKCGSDQIFADKKGFSGKKAVGGAILTGGIGLLAGTIGSNKVVITCLACGNQFQPGSTQTTSKIPVVQKVKTLGDYLIERFVYSLSLVIFIGITIYFINESSMIGVIGFLLIDIFIAAQLWKTIERIKRIKTGY